MAAVTEVRWGICGAGGISNDFSLALANNGSTIEAVAASDADKAAKFAADFKAKKSYGSYEALAADVDVNVVYVGTVHTKHMEHALLFIEAGKSVVVEKPMGINARQIETLHAKAQEKGVFIMEAFWTRMFPIVKQVKEILESKELGAVRNVSGEFGFIGPDDPKHRLWDRALAGGGLLDIGCYLVQFATLAYGHQSMPEVKALAELSATKVDARGVVSLRYPGLGTASLAYAIDTQYRENLVISCEKGAITIEEPSHCPTKVSVTRFTSRTDSETQVIELPLPTQTGDFGGRKINYPRSEGMIYQVQEVERCLKEGLQESPCVPRGDSLRIAQIMDAARREMGVEYDADMA